eukprot:647628-Prymnesium_polylepis.2
MPLLFYLEPPSPPGCRDALAATTTTTAFACFTKLACGDLRVKGAIQLVHVLEAMVQRHGASGSCCDVLHACENQQQEPQPPRLRVSAIQKHGKRQRQTRT